MNEDNGFHYRGKSYQKNSLKMIIKIKNDFCQL